VLPSVISLSDEAQIMMAPLAAYRRLAAEPPRSGLVTLLRRPALAAVVIGGAVGLTSTGDATVPTLLTTTICWCFVPAVQLVVAASLIALSRPRTGLRLAPVLDLFFAGQGPWLLWTLGVAAAALVAFRLGDHLLPRMRYILLFAVVPLIWTWAIIFAFCKAVLMQSARRAFGWTVLYQTAIWGIAYLYASAMTFQAWPFGQMRL
jgi:hypothetical protein